MRSSLRVLVAVDFSPQSLVVVRAARNLARPNPGRIVLAHVRPFSDVRAAVLEERGDLLRLPPGRLARAIAAHYADRFAKTVRPRKNEETLLLLGEPARELLREAVRGYDLLAMGTRGRGRTAAFLLGSTVQEVLVRSPIPLLVVPAGRSR